MREPNRSQPSPDPVAVSTPPVEESGLPVLDDSQLGGRCRSLRTKKMYVFEDAYEDPNPSEDDSVYWCAKTDMRNFGPDDEHVNGRDCRNPGRSCYEAL